MKEKGIFSRLTFLTAAALLSGCLLMEEKPAPSPVRGMRMAFSGMEWMNAVLDSLVIRDDSPAQMLHVTITRFNPYLQDADITLKAYPGQRINLTAEFYKSGRVVARAEASVVTAKSSRVNAGKTTLTRLPAWDSLIPQPASPGHLSFGAETVEIAWPGQSEGYVNVWNRNQESIDFSLESEDAWLGILPDTVLALSPGSDRLVSLQVDRARIPAATLTGRLLLHSSTAVDTVPVRYRSRLAPGKAWLRMRVLFRGSHAKTAGAEVAVARAANTEQAELLKTDAFGEAMDQEPALGLQHIVVRAESCLTLFDTTSVADGDTAMRLFFLDSIPRAPAFDFGTGASAKSPIYRLDGQWAVASQSLSGEGYIAYVNERPSPSTPVKTLPQGNLDSNGAAMLMQDMAFQGKALYLTYPSGKKVIEITNWRDNPRHDAISLPFLPFHIHPDGDAVILTGADSEGNAVLARRRMEAQVGTPPVLEWKTFPQIRASGVNLGLWGPVVAVLDSAHFAFMGQNTGNRAVYARLRRADFSAQDGRFLTLDDCDGRTLLMRGPHLLCLDPEAKQLTRYDTEGRKTGSLKLPWEPRYLRAGETPAGKTVTEVEGRQGEKLWVDEAWMKISGGVE